MDGRWCNYVGGVPRTEALRRYEDHPGLQWLRSCAAGEAWLQELSRLVSECSEEWELSVGAPFDYAYTSIVLRALRRDKTPVALKLQFPGRESEREADALRAWDGCGAVRLLAHDSPRRALLLERCLPGTALLETGAEHALDVLIELLPRLCIPATSVFRSLVEEAEVWATSLPESWERCGEPFERELLEIGLEFLDALAPSQGEQVLIHQDLHAANVLRAHREPWLAIDPKPVVGEMEFAVAPIVRGGELGHSRRLVVGRLDRLTSALGLDRERARGWTLVQTLAWSFSDEGTLTDLVDVARWLVDNG
jgi:streptomycin 6-kinase